MGYGGLEVIWRGSAAIRPNLRKGPTQDGQTNHGGTEHPASSRVFRSKSKEISQAPDQPTG